MTTHTEIKELCEFTEAEEPLATSENAVLVQERGARDENDIAGGHQLGKEQMWAVYGGKVFSPCETAVTGLPPGQYTIDYNQNIGLHFSKTSVALDDLLILPDSVTEEVLEQVKSFWNKEEHFRKFGFLWKRGMMLWGPPGSGKTSALQLISKYVIDEGGIAVYITNPDLAAGGLRILRNIEPTRKLVVMIEDIDAIISRYGESELLAILDGELQIDNVLFISTTNYPERLDKRFRNRPSRFDYVRKVGMPSTEAREKYLLARNERLANSPEELDEWVSRTKGFSVAHLKELIVSVEVFEVEFDTAVSRLKAMSDEISSDDDDHNQVGFVRDC